MIVGSVLAALSQLCVGCAVMALVPSTALREHSRCAKLAVVLLSGLALTTLFMMMLLCLGGHWDIRWVYAWGATGSVVVVLRMRNFLSHWKFCANEAPTRVSAPLIPIIMSLAALGLWVVVAAACLPSVDYDSIAIWSYRVRVLLTEGTLYSRSLRDPLRIAPMPKHPYFVPVMEAIYCGSQGFSHVATHVPHLVLYAVYLLLSVAFVKESLSGRLRDAGLAALVAMPAPAVQWWLEGAREPVIGVASVWSLYWLIVWLRSRAFVALLFMGLGALTNYHVKIEGAVLAAGFLLAVFIAGLTAPTHRAHRIRQALAVAVGVAFLSLPWVIAKATIPPSQQDYDFTHGFTWGWAERLRWVPPVMWMFVSETFLRPELYALSPLAATIWLACGLRRRTVREAMIVLLPIVLCMAGIFAIYVIRQEQLGPARNTTFSRRFVCFIPTLVLASAYLAERAKRSRNSPPA